MQMEDALRRAGDYAYDTIEWLACMTEAHTMAAVASIPGLIINAVHEVQSERKQVQERARAGFTDAIKRHRDR